MKKFGKLVIFGSSTACPPFNALIGGLFVAVIVHLITLVRSVPLIVVLLVITGLFGKMVIVNICVPVPPAFVAFTVSTNVPDTVGVPLSTLPVHVNPAGIVPVIA